MKVCRAAAVFATGLLSLSAAGQQAQVNLDYNPQKNDKNLVPYGAKLISPEVNDDQTVLFRVQAPAAREVTLASGPIQAALGLKKAPAFQKGDNGLWTLKLGPLPPNMYVYRFNVDGMSFADPNNTVASNSDQPPYSQLVIHGSGPAYYDARNVPHGNVTRHIYHSNVLQGEREMYVYTPPGYDRTKKYPVLYLVGGSGEMAHSWMTDGRANFIEDNLIADGKAVPMIIAMPNNQVVHRTLPNHAELTFKLFEAELRQQIIPLVEQNYSVRADRHGRALAGLSMGGRHTQLVGFKSLDLFASFGVLSAGDPDSEKVSSEFLNDPEIAKKIDYLFVGQGTHEEVPGSRTFALRDALVKHKIPHEYYAGGNGAHDWATWRHLLYAKFLPNLWRKG